MTTAESLRRKATNATMTGSILRIQMVKPAPKSREDIWLSLFVGLAWLPAAGALLMLGFSAAHSMWSVVPAPDFWTSVQLYIGVRVLSAAIHHERNGWWE